MPDHTQDFTLPAPTPHMPRDTPAWKRLGIKLEFARVKSANGPNEDQVFRFLDLPAEMRNLVYRELLVWPSNRPERCWPQILSTCRQVNDEAKDIIYTENAARVEVVITAERFAPSIPCTYEDDRDDFWSLEFKGGKASNVRDDHIDPDSEEAFVDRDDKVDDEAAEALKAFDFRCSPFLLTQTSVQFDIKLQSNVNRGRPQPRKVAAILSQVLYTLSSAFLHCKALENLRVCFDRVEPEVGDSFGNEVLWSLSKLGLPATALSIEGLCTSDTRDWAQVISSCDPGCSVDLLPRLHRAHMVSQRLLDSLKRQKSVKCSDIAFMLDDEALQTDSKIEDVSHAAYKEAITQAQNFRSIRSDDFERLAKQILDREGEVWMIGTTKRMERWLKTAVKALEPEFEAAKAKIDGVLDGLRRIAELPQT